MKITLLTRLKHSLIAFLIGFSILNPITSLADSPPIKLHPDNNHYFEFRGEPTVLITSAEHYGAVLNLEFDYTTYLSELENKGLNYTRIFTGPYVEEPGWSVLPSPNNLAPRPGYFIAPWARSTVSGYAGGGNKFDLNTWNTSYFQRLKDFVDKAGQKGIIVEVTLFSPYYDNTKWNYSPLKSSNNVNGIGTVGRLDVLNINKNGNLQSVMEDMTIKICQELKDYDNVIYEIANEPYWPDADSPNSSDPELSQIGCHMDWQRRMASLIDSVESTYTYKHLIAQNMDNYWTDITIDQGKLTDATTETTIFNFHYSARLDNYIDNTIGLNYHLNKPIALDETGYVSGGNGENVYRHQAWKWLTAGGATYNNLDFTFDTDYPSGNQTNPHSQWGGGATLRAQLGYLSNILHSMDFINMQPHNDLPKSGGIISLVSPSSVKVKCLANTGSEYLVYAYGGSQVNLSFNLNSGEYTAFWYNTKTGVTISSATFSHSGGNKTLNSPTYTEQDIALKIISTSIQQGTVLFAEDWEYNSGEKSTNGLLYTNASYQWSFETNLQNEGRVRWGVNSHLPQSGNGAISMDRNPSLPGTNATNFAILTLDLSAYATSTELELSFGWVDHGDEEQNNDKVWIRGNNTDPWVTIYDLAPENTADDIYQQVANLDIDAILASASQTIGKTFQLRFGQEDDYNTDWDGISFDNIVIKDLSEGDLTPIALPFNEGWEASNGTTQFDGLMNSGSSFKWDYSTNSQGKGRVQWGSNAFQKSSGSGALTLDRYPSVAGSNATNYATLTLNLSDYVSSTNLELSFGWVDHGDEEQANDKVWVRGSESDPWVVIYDLAPENAADDIYQQVSGLDIDATLASASQTIGTTFQLRFGQEDDYSIDWDGISFDNIVIEETEGGDLTQVSLPFNENWETSNGSTQFDGLINSGSSFKWDYSTNSQGKGRVQWGSNAFQKSSGSGALTLDRYPSVAGSNATNYATLTLNLSDYVSSTNLELSFGWVDHGDEEQANDKVWVRGSESDPWVVIYDLAPENAADDIYQQVTGLDIDAVLASATQTVGTTFQLRFGQEDDYSIDWDGISFDNIIIEEATGGLTQIVLPFNEDWETANGSTQYNGLIYSDAAFQWDYNTNAQGEGRAQWGSNAFQINSGIGALTLDKFPSDASSNAANFAILTLNLSAYSSSTDLELSFWWTDHGDEDQVNDKVWVRGTDTDPWVIIYDIDPQYAADDTYQQVSGLDIDAALTSASQTIGSSFQIKFGQEDNYSIDYDGISYDDIVLKEGSGGLTATVLPFIEDFEASNGSTQYDGVIGSDPTFIWDYSTNAQGEGRAQWGSNAYQAKSGSGALTFDRYPSVAGDYATNYATLTLNLSAYASSTDLELSFWWADHGDEDQNNDKIWVRGSTTDPWVIIYDLDPQYAADDIYKQVTGLDIDAVLASASQIIGNSFQLRIGQEDDYSIAWDGISFDDLVISNNGSAKSQELQSIPEDIESVTAEHNLINYPNPFSRSTTIDFSLNHSVQTQLIVYNSIGQQIAVLFDDVAEKDRTYSLTFDGNNHPNGIYFYRLISGNKTLENKKMILQK